MGSVVERIFYLTFTSRQSDPSRYLTFTAKIPFIIYSLQLTIMSLPRLIDLALLNTNLLR